MTPAYVFYTMLGVGLILVVVRKGDIVFSFKAPWLTFFIGAKEKDRDLRRRGERREQSRHYRMSANSLPISAPDVQNAQLNLQSFGVEFETGRQPSCEAVVGDGHTEST